MNAPTFNMNIPLNHPWAKIVLNAIASRWDSDARYPTGTMKFGGQECMTSLMSVNEIHYENGQHAESAYIGTTWKAYPIAPPPPPEGT